MKISLKPHTYESSVKQGLMAYNESQIIKVILTEDLEDPETNKQYQESFNRLAELLVELTADSIISFLRLISNYQCI